MNKKRIISVLLISAMLLTSNGFMTLAESVDDIVDNPTIEDTSIDLVDENISSASLIDVADENEIDALGDAIYDDSYIEEAESDDKSIEQVSIDDSLEVFSTNEINNEDSDGEVDNNIEQTTIGNS